MGERPWGRWLLSSGLIFGDEVVVVAGIELQAFWCKIADKRSVMRLAVSVLTVRFIPRHQCITGRIRIAIVVFVGNGDGWGQRNGYVASSPQWLYASYQSHPARKAKSLTLQFVPMELLLGQYRDTYIRYVWYVFLKAAFCLTSCQAVVGVRHSISIARVAIVQSRSPFPQYCAAVPASKYTALS